METEWSGVERRRALRFGLALPLHVVRLRGRKVDLRGETRDLSSNGAFLLIPGGAPAGASIEFVVTLQDAAPLGEKVRLRCQGHVVRATRGDKPGRHGVATTIDRYQFSREAIQ